VNSRGRLTPRAHYVEELRSLEEQTLGGLDLVVRSLDRVLEAVQAQNAELAREVVADDDRIDGRFMEIHTRVLSLIALQAPVASQLRLVAALLNVSRHVERMGDQCVNIAKLIPLGRSEPPISAGILERIDEMGRAARALVIQAKRAFASRDLALAESLVDADDRIDHLNRAVFQIALDVGDDPAVREKAMHMMLMARCIERIGDNAVDIGEQTAFVVTGLFREFVDASHPVPSHAAGPG
jgi:phosphate transport system protein